MSGLRDVNESTEDLKSWLVATGCCFINCLLISPFRLAGLIYVELIEKYSIDRSQASIPMFMSACVISLIGPFTGFIGKKIGPGNIVICGCIIASVGIGGNFFAEDIITVTVLLGFLYGIGFSAGSMMLPSILQIHFKKNYNSASGIFNAGACLAAFIFPPITVLLFQKYGISGSLLTLSGIMINSVPVAIMIKKAGIKNVKFSVSQMTSDEVKIEENSDLKITSCEEPDKEKVLLSLSKELQNFVSVEKYSYNKNLTKKNKIIFEDNYKEDYFVNKHDTKIFKSVITTELTTPTNKDQLVKQSNDLHNNFIKENRGFILSSSCLDSKYVENLEEQNNFPCILQKNTNKKENETCFAIKSNENNLLSCYGYMSVFLDPSFLIIMLLNSSVIYFITTIRTTLIDYSRDKTISREYEPYLLMLQSVCDLIGRLAFVWVVDKNYLTSASFTIMGFLVTASSIVGIAISNKITGFIIGASFFEISTGALMTVLTSMLVEYLEQDKLTILIPCRFFLYAPMSFTSFPLIGYFRKKSNSYDGLYYILVALSLVCSLMTPLAVRFSKNFKRKNTTF